MMIALILLILCVLLILTFSIGLATYAMTGKRQTYEEAYTWQSEHYDTGFYETLKKTDYTVTSYDGYILHARFLENPVPTDKYMLITHGYTDNMLGNLKYARMYLDLGYHCIIYDLRGHGANKRTFVTYGIRENRDLICMIEDSRKRYPEMKILGLHGESLGAASTAMCMKHHPQVDFAVADCGFADIENVIRGAIKNMHLPAFSFELACFGGILKYHYNLKKMRPIDSLGENTVPMLFLHGEADDFILPENSRRMAEATAGYSEVHLIPGAGHAESVLKDTAAYRQYVEAFLEKVFSGTQA